MLNKIRQILKRKVKGRKNKTDLPEKNDEKVTIKKTQTLNELFRKYWECALLPIL